MHQYLALGLAAVAIAAPAPATKQTVSLARRSLQHADGSVNELALIQTLQRTLLKYNLPGFENLPEGLQKRASANVPLTDQVDQGEDDLYYGAATVGKAEFTLDFDTGSADLFVPGPNCGQSQGCVNNGKYDNSGEDQKKTTTVMYGSGQVSGEDYKDSVSVGGLTVKSQGFISLSDASGFETSSADGLMGMGFSNLANDGFPTFFENLISQGSVSAKEFSFYLGRAQSGTQKSSSLTLGGRNQQSYTGDIVAECAVTKKGYWQVALDGVSVNGESAGASTKGSAAIDTGTTIVLGPTAAVQAIMAKIPGAQPMSMQGGGGSSDASGSGGSVEMYAYPCNTDAKHVPSLTFAGKDLAINPLDFNLGSVQPQSSSLFSLLDLINDATGSGSSTPAQDGLCVAGIGGLDVPNDPGLYIVGDVFLKNWYSIYSYDGPSVSFAAAAGNQ